MTEILPIRRKTLFNQSTKPPPLIKTLLCKSGSFLGHLSHSGDQLLWVGVRHRPVTSSQEVLGQSLLNLACSTCMVRRQRIVNFIPPPNPIVNFITPPIPRGGNFGVKLMYFFKNLLFYCVTWFIVYSKDYQGRVYRSCKFHDPRSRDSFAEEWPNKLYSENALFLLYS